STFGNNVTGTGTLATFNDVTFSGNTINLTGTLRVSGNGRLTIQNGVAATFGDAWLNSNSATGTANTVITGGSLTITGAARDNRDAYFHVTQSGGQVSLGGLYTGQTDGGNEGGYGGNSTYTLIGGTLTARAIQGGGGGGWWDRGITLNLGGGTLRAGASFTMNANTVNLTGVNGNATIDTQAFTLTSNYGFSGAGGLVKNGPGTLRLNGVSPYAGGTFINDGTLELGHATNTLANTGAITINGAAACLALGGNADTVGAVTLKNGSITGTSGVLTATGYAVESGLISAGLAGVGAGLIKSTAGTVTLGGANTYTGATQVNEGTLIISGSTSATGLIIVSAGGTLGGGGQGGTVTFADGGTLAPGDGSDSHFEVANLSLTDGSILAFDLGTPLPVGEFIPSFWYDHVIITGGLTLDGKLRINPLSNGDTDFGTPIEGDRWLLMTYPAGGGSLTDHTLDVDTANSPALSPGLGYQVDTSNDGYVYVVAVAVPEAGTASLLLMGLALILRKKPRR
ncbi:MAG: autotransporter-associated beta strand repeat-containing protein, partial [Kiritimatiellia bacterium]